jgi:hypothetical protein
MSPKVRNALIITVTLIVAFGIGAAWQFAQADRARRELAEVTAELDATRHEVNLEKLQSTLALATVAAQLGNHERARQLTSDFFTGLQEVSADVSDAERAAFDRILLGRDNLITRLSRAEPEAGLELARLLGSYQGALGRQTDGLPTGAPTQMPAADTMS